MKALTLWQPWASLMVNGKRPGQWRKDGTGNRRRSILEPWKMVETRGWETKYRDPIAMHSALRKEKWLGTSSESAGFMEQYKLTGLPPFDDLPTGCILGIGNLVEIKHTEDHYELLEDMENVFGNYEDGRYAWIFEGMEQFETPIPVKGNRLLWEWKQ